MDQKKTQPVTNILLHINGGLGKCIMATAVIRSYKQANPESKVVVVSGYPEVFLNNPDVKRNFPFNTPYLWQDYYGKMPVKVFAQDPYLSNSWIKNNGKHLIDVWCEELGVPSIQKTPLLFFSSAEVDELQSMIQTDKPLVVVQSTGGSNASARSWTRNPSTNDWESILGKFLENSYVLHLAVPQTPVLKNVHQRLDNLDRRKAMCLIYYANSVIGIDSFGLHTRAANPDAKDSIFYFILEEMVPKLGYAHPGHTYITPRPEVKELLKDKQGYYANLFRFGIEELTENCPVPANFSNWF
jgi:hypothetical protein